MRATPIAIQYSGRLLPAPKSALGYMLIGIACWLFAATIALIVMTKAAWLSSSDLSIDEPLHTLGVDVHWLGDWALLWQKLGTSSTSVVLVSAAVIALLIMRKWGWAGYVFACAVGGLIISEVLKRSIDRPRPTWTDPLFIETGGSFPSGHTMVGIYGYCVIGLVAMYVIKRPTGTVLGWILVVIGLLMGPSRLVLGVHWPSDVVAGWMLALGWVLIVSAVALTLTYRRQSKRNKADDGANISTT